MFLTKMLFCRQCPRVLHPVSLGKSLYCSCNGLRMDLFVWRHMCFNWGMRKASTRLMGQECAGNVFVSITLSQLSEPIWSTLKVPL